MRSTSPRQWAKTCPPCLLCKGLTGAYRSCLRRPLPGEGESSRKRSSGGRPPRPCLYVKPAGAPRGAKVKVVARAPRGKKRGDLWADVCGRSLIYTGAPVASRRQQQCHRTVDLLSTSPLHVLRRHIAHAQPCNMYTRGEGRAKPCLNPHQPSESGQILIDTDTVTQTSGKQPLRARRLVGFDLRL